MSTLNHSVMTPWLTFPVVFVPRRNAPAQQHAWLTKIKKYPDRTLHEGAVLASSWSGYCYSGGLPGRRSRLDLHKTVCWHYPDKGDPYENS
jgi:hypothetical protein